MKILVITHYYAPEFGAPQRRWRSLVRAFRDAGHQVVVVAPPPHYPHGNVKQEHRHLFAPGTAAWGEFGEYVMRTSYLPHKEDVLSRTADHAVAGASAVARIVRELGGKERRPDIVIATAPGVPSLFVGQAVAKVFRVPFIAEMRDAWPDLVTHVHAEKPGTAEVLRDAKQASAHPSLMTRGRNLLSEAIKREVHAGVTKVQRLADQVVTTTEGFAHVLESRGVERPVVIRNGANTAQVKLAPPRENASGVLRVLYFGNKGRAQGLDTLVRAAAQAQRQGVALDVRIIGHGVENERLASLARELDAPVRVLPRVSHEEAAAHYAWADTVVVSLKNWVPFEWTVPSKTYEILATGRHITACVKGETARIVARSGAGDVVEPGDVDALVEHFARLVEFPELLEREGRGRAWLEQRASTTALSEEYVQMVGNVLRAVRHGRVPVVATERPVQLARNAAVALEVAARHITDDPALFAVQLSRRAPRRVAKAAGRALDRAGRRLPGGRGLVALGLFIGGDSRGVAEVLAEPGRPSRLAAEVGVLVDRHAGLDAAPASTVARARWAEGDTSGALDVLSMSSQREERAMRERLESEARLLQPGFSLINNDLEARAGCLMHDYVPASGKNVRVLHVLTNSLPHTQSGYTLRSHAILRAQVESGMEVRAVTRVGYPVLVGKAFARDVDVVDGVTYARVLPWVLSSTIEERLRQQVLMVVEHVARFRPTVIHTTTNYTNALVAKAVSELTGVPWVFEVRGLMEQTWAASKRTHEAHEKAIASERYAAIAAREAELARSADAVVTIAETMRRELGARGVDAESVALVPNSVDADLFTRRMSPVEARQALGLAADGFWVGAVASLVGYEGFETLLRAVARARSFGEDVRVLLAGDGVSRPALERLAEELGIWDQCHFPGRVAREDAPMYVQALNAVVVPRRDSPVTRNVTPLKPVEAMALARPVIVSDIPALRELVLSADGAKVLKDGHFGTVTSELIGPAGMLVKPDDPNDLALTIRDLMHEPHMYRALVASGEAIARERTWDAAMATYGDVYARVMRGVFEECE